MNLQDYLHKREKLSVIVKLIDNDEPSEAYDNLCEVMGGLTIYGGYFKAKFSVIDESDTITGMKELVCCFHNRDSGEFINSTLVHTTDDLLLVDITIDRMDYDYVKEMWASDNINQ